MILLKTTELLPMLQTKRKSVMTRNPFIIEEKAKSHKDFNNTLNG